VEVISPPFSGLNQLAAKSEAVTRTVATAAKGNGVRLLAYGMQPLTPNHELTWVDHPRYCALRSVIKKDAIDRVLGTASQQCHVDITQSEAIPALNALNGLSGLMIAMFCHSPVCEGRKSDHKTMRTIAYNRFPQDRVGLLPPFSDLEQWTNYLLDRQLLFYQDQDQFTAYQESFSSFLNNGHNLSPETALSELLGLEATLWPEARLRWRENRCTTIEVRCACPQMPGEHTVSALSLGLIENLGATTELYERLDHHRWQEVRRLAIKHGLSFQYDSLSRGSIADAANELINIAEQGLKERGLGEEVFLGPLRERVSCKTTLADEAIAIFEREGIEGLVSSRSWPT
jgi:glutamate--cysteine ligase